VDDRERGLPDSGDSPEGATEDPEPDVDRHPHAAVERHGPTWVLATGLFATAGVLAIASNILKWGSATFPESPSKTVTGYLGHAEIGLFVGLLLLGSAYVTWRGTDSQRRTGGLLGALGAAVLLGFAIYDVSTIPHRLLSELASGVADRLGVPVAQVRAVIDQQVAQGVITVKRLPGLSLAMLAGIVGLAGGVVLQVSLRARSRLELDDDFDQFDY